jgi:hypothetical protein
MQKLPSKKKTTKKRLDDREIEIKEEYYKELLKFYENNEANNFANGKIYNANYIDKDDIVNFPFKRNIV